MKLQRDFINSLSYNPRDNYKKKLFVSEIKMVPATKIIPMAEAFPLPIAEQILAEPILKRQILKND
jgi:hypothetical protein